MVDIRPYIEGDEFKIEPVEGAIPTHPKFKKKWDELVRPDLAWSSYDADGNIIGLGGIVPYKRDAYIWIILDKKAIERKPSIFRGIEELETLQKIVKFAESFRFSCIWTYVQDGYRLGHKLAAFLGFVNVGLKENNCWLYLKEA